MPSAGVSAGSLAPDFLTNLVNSCFESLGFMWCVLLSGLTTRAHSRRATNARSVPEPTPGVECSAIVRHHGQLCACVLKCPVVVSSARIGGQIPGRLQL